MVGRPVTGGARVRYNDYMIKAFLSALVLVWLLAGCGPAASATAAPTVAPSLAPAAKATAAPAPILAPGVTPAATLVLANCAGPEVNALAAAIASDFPQTSAGQVMEWFCAGAEFEDILTALETAGLTDTPPEEMLQMLAAGMNWDEIWQVLGISK